MDNCCFIPLFVFEVRQHRCPPYHGCIEIWRWRARHILRACVRCYFANAQLHQQLFVCVCVVPRRSETKSIMLYPFMAQWLLRKFAVKLVLLCLLQILSNNIISLSLIRTGIGMKRIESELMCYWVWATARHHSH